MCLICLKLNEKSIKFYDARLMAGEYRMMIGEEHYKELIKLLDMLEAPPLKEPEPQEDYNEELDKYDDDGYTYFGNMGIGED